MTHNLSDEEGASVIRATSSMFSGLNDKAIEEIDLSSEFLL